MFFKRITTTSLLAPITIVVLLMSITSLSAFQRVINANDGFLTTFSSGYVLNTHSEIYVSNSFQAASRNELPEEFSILPAGQQGNQGEEHLLLLKQWNELFSKIREEEKLVQNVFRDATNAQFKASQQLKTAESNKKLVESDKLAMLTDQYEKSILNLKEAKSRQKEVKKLLEKARKINSKPADITEKKLTKTRTEYNMLMTRYSPERLQQSEPAQPIPKSQPEPKTPSQPRPDSPSPKKKPVNAVPDEKPAIAVTDNLNTEYDPDMVNKRPGQSRDKPYASKPFDCMFESDSIDQASGLTRQSIRPSLIFTYTDPDLRQYFKDKELITCVGRISRIGQFIYLTIEFQIASSHSQGNFGSLQNGSLLRFKLMNDEYVSLYNLKTNEGRIDPYSGYTVFAGQYALGKEEIKKLRSSELDKMRVMWSTGFEDYDIYHLDFLINQLNCLMEKK